MHVLYSQITLATAVVTILAVLFYAFTGISVGRMRGKHQIKAPAMTGHPEFETAVRVQMNTLEWMPIVLPLLWLATIYFSTEISTSWLAWLPPVVGLIWVIGRIVYRTGYMTSPESRETGFIIAAISALVLLILAIVGIVMSWSAVAAM